MPTHVAMTCSTCALTGAARSSEKSGSLRSTAYLMTSAQPLRYSSGGRVRSVSGSQSTRLG